MTFNLILHIIAFISGIILYGFILRRAADTFVGRILAMGVVILTAEAGLTGLLLGADTVASFQSLLYMKLLLASFLPGTWLLFSLSFGRSNFEEFIFNWRWVLSLAFLVPLALVIFMGDQFILQVSLDDKRYPVYLGLGWSGYMWYLCWSVCAVVILMNLERTFRHVTGHMQWQIKFLFVGLVGLFGVRIYTGSQAIIFQAVNLESELINAGALVLANILIGISLPRGRLSNVHVFLSQSFLYNSFTVAITGIYFIGAGILAWLSVRWGISQDLPLATFVMFMAVVGYAIVMMSGRLRLGRKRFISKHFKRPMYDYQMVWERFTTGTVSLTNTRALCDFVVKMVSDTLEIPSVTIWMVDEKRETLIWGGSTILSPGSSDGDAFREGGQRFVDAMFLQSLPVDLETADDDWVEDLRIYYQDELRKGEARYCAPLKASGQLVGIMALGNNISQTPLSFEDNELLRTLADQAAAMLLNLRLSDHLRRVREMEAFQTMSAFFMHDLKNLASKLSLVTQNLPIHMDNPAFREDALRTISQSVTKIKDMCSRLSLLSQKLVIDKMETDINDMVSSVLAGMEELLKVKVEPDLNSVPAAMIDREQMSKVIENLLMNAREAIGQNGKILVKTGYDGQWVSIEVTDDGSGMSSEFIDKRLFQPFQTTKQQGMGIGLFHCKTIVEAHGGRIEVESTEGKGSTFKVKLPVSD